MKDKYKTKDQLINELLEMRRRIAELETSEVDRQQAKVEPAGQGGEISDTDKILQEKERLMAAFDQIGRLVLVSLDEEQVLDALAGQIVEAGIFRSLMIALVDEESRTVEVVRNLHAVHHPDGTVFKKVGGAIGLRYNLEDDNITAEVARTGEMKVIVGWNTRFDQRLDRPEYRSGQASYFIPVKQGNRVRAVLATGSGIEEKEEMLHRIEVMRPLLNQVAVALEHAWLYKALRQSEEKLRAQYKGIPIPTYTWQRSGEDFVLVDYNDAALATTNGKIADLVGEKFRKIYRDMPEMLKEMSRCFTEKTSIKSERQIQIDPTGKSKLFAVSYAFVPPDLVMVHTEDITQRKQAEKELKQSFEKLRRAMRGTIHAITSTVERRDPYTAGHQRRMADLARAIGAEMRLSKERVDGIRMSGVIHDLGKISIPSEILSKPGKITEIEFNLIKIHPQVGYDILKPIEFPWPVARIVLQHHERMDGSGYPSGLKGEDILMEARILGVADVVEAMSSHRPYRPALGIDMALKEISQNRGILYDPEVVDICLELFNGGKFDFDYRARNEIDDRER